MASLNQVKFNINPQRLKYLLDLYRLSRAGFLNLLNRGRKIGIVSAESLNEILEQKEEVDEGLLKRIDKIFEKGITWYITDRKVSDVKKSSIFFRKESFNSEIKFESIRIVHKYEELSTDIQILGNYINFIPAKRIRKYHLAEDPVKAAGEVFSAVSDIQDGLIEKKVIPRARQGEDRVFLKNLIRALEQLDVFVFEHLEMPRKKEKVDFNGFFVAPNTIVIKKQEYIRREIFTLAHEFAHYILELEEIDDLIEEKANFRKNEAERWCNTFSFYFLLNHKKSDFEKMGRAVIENEFLKKEIGELYDSTFLSYSAFYTRLLIDGKIVKQNYDKIMEETRMLMKKGKEERRNRFRMENEKRAAEGKEPLHPSFKPIESHLFKELVKINYFEGNINENRLREYLKIKPEKNIKEVIY